MNAPKPPAGLIRKLHGWELLHLREHSARLEAQVEALMTEVDRLQREVQAADDCANSWRDDVMRMMEEDGAQFGLTQSGHVVALQPLGGATPHPNATSEAITAIRTRAQHLAGEEGLADRARGFWEGVDKGLADLEDGVGLQLAAKDAQRVIPGAGAGLTESGELLSVIPVEQGDPAQGLQVAGNQCADLHVDAIQKLDHEVVAVVGIDHDKHSAGQVDRKDTAGSHGGSVARADA